MDRATWRRAARRLLPLSLVVLALALAAAPPAAQGQEPSGPVPLLGPVRALLGSVGLGPEGARVAAQEPRSAAWVLKIDSHLARVARLARDVGPAAAAAEARARGLRVVEDPAQARVQVVVESQSLDRRAVRTLLTALGGQVQAEYANLVRALLPAQALEAVASDAAVRYVRPPHRPYPTAVAGEEVGATNATAWQAAGLTGAGVKVGIVDLGFAGYTARQASGDLPASLTTADFGCGSDFASTEPHGTAVAEIVHEMAPSAALYLICIDDEIDLGQAKDYAIAQGIQIINHSVAWFNTARGDGTGGPGTPDAIVADARAKGILWVNAAGNYQQRHWSGTFNDTDGDGFHNFTPTQNYNAITFPGGATLCFFLKWDDWPASAQDYDFYLVSVPGGTPLLSSTSFQTGSQPPTEFICAVNNGPTVTVGLAIRRFSATQTPRFDLISTGANLQFQVPAGSIIEPASSPHVLAAGAICWQNDALEPYSSLGPTIDGRTKPDIAGQDAMSSATYGAFTTCGNSGFAGTSAAAPTVAGAAALVKQANPTFTRDQLAAYLIGQAVDLGPAGPDNSFGAGKLRLLPPRTNVGVGVAPATAGRLLVTVTARDAACSPNNALQSVQVTRLDNATVEWPGPPPTTISAPTTLPVPGTPASYRFTVVRTTPGVASTVHLVVTDGCGTWPTFVGGGPNAF